MSDKTKITKEKIVKESKKLVNTAMKNSKEIGSMVLAKSKQLQNVAMKKGKELKTAIAKKGKELQGVAIIKGKALKEIASIKLEIAKLEKEIKDAKMQIGNIVAENGFPLDDIESEIKNLVAKIRKNKNLVDKKNNEVKTLLAK